MNLRIRLRDRQTREAVAKLQTVRAALSSERLTPIVEREAQTAWRNVVSATPKGWTGNTRQGWKIERPKPGVRVVANPMKVALFLEEGTANGGTGRIFPRVKRFLYIPLNARAALGGWNATLRRGVDYILRRSVRGIRPRWIARTEGEAAEVRLVKAVQDYIRGILS